MRRMVVQFAVWLVVIGLAFGSAAQEARKEPPLRLVVELTDSSLIIGTTDLKTLPIRSESFGKVNVLLKMVESIEFRENREMVQVNVENGDRISGVLDVPAFNLLTLFGKVSIPAAHVVAVHVPKAGARVSVKLRELPIIFVPRQREGRKLANEQAVIGTLKAIANGQQTFQTRRYVDQDWDGTGEYGFLQEITGVARNVRIDSGGRGGGGPGIGEILPRALGVLDANGIATKSGYMFHMFLPSGDLAGVDAIAETPVLPAGDDHNADDQETRWCCYAWPAKLGVTGERAFVINQQGMVYETDNRTQRYSGAATTPTANAAFRPGTPNIDGPLAAGAARIDGGVWKASGG